MSRQIAALLLGLMVLGFGFFMYYRQSAGSRSAAPGPGGGGTASAVDVSDLDPEAIARYFRAVPDDELPAAIESTRIAVTERLLAPRAKHVKKYDDLAGGTDSGVHRILERGRFEGLTTGRGGGAYFSFSTLRNDYNARPDLQLERGTLSSGFAGGDFGVVQTIGDVPIRDVGLDDVLGMFLEDDPAVFKERGRGAEDRPEAMVGITYVVRSVRWNGSDLLVAFRIVDRDANGITFVWRVLKRFPPPVRGRPTEH